MSGSFNTYEPPFDLKVEDISISVLEEKDKLVYKREAPFGTLESLILRKDSNIIINPIEPVNIPKSISPFLLIELGKTLIIGPESKQKIFITFPTEIGVFVSYKSGDYKLLDVLGLTRSKYTLYGTHNRGMICKYWKSDVFSSEPETNIHFEGSIELEVTNDTKEWVELSKVVFNAYGMKIYYGNGRLAMRANLRILGKYMAETSFTTYPTTSIFKRSTELYTAHKLILNGSKHIMEYGL